MVRRIAYGLVLAVSLSAFTVAGETRITTGAGYQKMLEQLCEAYRQEGGGIEEMYGGNIGQMLTQIK